MTMNWTYRSPHGRQKGFSLVEVMIALVLSLFLIGAVLLMFASSQSSAKHVENLSRQQENIRFAADLLVRDIRNAGFRDDPDASIAASNFDISDDGSGGYLEFDGESLIVRYVGDGSCSETFVSRRLVVNKYYEDGGQLFCQGNRDGELKPDGDAVGLVRGLKVGGGLSFERICPSGDGDACECQYDSLSLAGVREACIGVRINLNFEPVDGTDPSIVLTAALRNVLLDRMRADPE